MPVQQLAPPSVADIRRDLFNLEQKYSTSTAAFVAADGYVPGIDEEDAVEWLYRAEQLRVLEEPEVFSPYSRTERATTLKGCTNVMEVMDQLAA